MFKIKTEEPKHLDVALHDTASTNSIRSDVHPHILHIMIRPQ